MKLVISVRLSDGELNMDYRQSVENDERFSVTDLPMPITKNQLAVHLAEIAFSMCCEMLAAHAQEVKQ